MKKLHRLAWLAQTFGKEMVAEYYACYDYTDIRLAVKGFQERGILPGMRTDLIEGSTQGLLMPFVHHVNDLEDARGVWNEHGSKLVYIVSESINPVLCNGVAERWSDEHVFFEINDKEPEASQRGMYSNPSNIRKFVLGPGSRFVRRETGRDGLPCPGELMLPCYNPEWGRVLGLEDIYRAMFRGGADELTFSVKMDKRCILW